jgi:hypothetical protein
MIVRAAGGAAAVLLSARDGIIDARGRPVVRPLKIFVCVPQLFDLPELARSIGVSDCPFCPCGTGEYDRLLDLAVPAGHDDCRRRWHVPNSQY